MIFTLISLERKTAKASLMFGILPKFANSSSINRTCKYSFLGGILSILYSSVLKAKINIMVVKKLKVVSMSGIGR